MKITNLRPRIITISHGEEEVRLLPAGVAVEVSKELGECKFTKLLEKSGDISISKQTKIEELKEECDLLDIEYKSNATVAQLTKLIEGA